jgi:hypothetical protein
MVLALDLCMVVWSC